MHKRLSTLLAALLVLFVQEASAQWSLSGNNATSTSKLGTTNSIDLRFFTNNLERARILSSSGYVGIGSTAPNTRLMVNSISGTSPFRAQVADNTKLLVHSGGGVAVGANVYVAGRSILNNQLSVTQGGMRVDLHDAADTGLVVRSSGYDSKQIGVVASG